jgi:hypothetical protein
MRKEKFEPYCAGQLPKEILDPTHVYVAYVWDLAETRQNAVTALLEQAQGFGYRLRYWWLSEAMALGETPDRLIVCVHYPSQSEDAGMDVYDALTERGARWDGLGAAAVEEYQRYGKPISALGDIRKTDGAILFPLSTLDDSLPDIDEPLANPITDFLVQFTVSGFMLVHARDALEANQQATTFLQAISPKTGMSPDTLMEEGSQVNLGETTVVIDDVQALEFPQELPNDPDSENP